MATEFTPHYNLDKYTAQDKPNLRDQYNAAMDKIDLALLSANTDAAEAKAATQDFQTQLDTKASKTEVATDIATAIEPLATKTEVENLKRKGDVTYYGAVSGSQTNDWANIFSSCIADCESIHFPSGKWYIQGSYDINSAKQISADSPLIFTNQSSQLNIITPYTKRACLINGITFIGNGVAEHALHMPSGSTNAANIIGCEFIDFTSSAIYAEALGLLVNGCNFHDNVARNNETIANRMIGIQGLTDNEIVGCKFFHQLTGIICDGYSLISNCYFYSAPHNTRKSCGIMPKSSVMVGVTINNCEFDTIQFSIGACHDSRITENLFMWDEGCNQITSIFYGERPLKNNYLLFRTEFSNNIVRGGAANIPVNHTIQMFYIESSISDANIIAYKSVNNSFIPLNTTNETVKLFMGFSGNGGDPDSSSKWVHFVRAYPYTGMPSGGRLTMYNGGMCLTTYIMSEGRKGIVAPDAVRTYLHNPVAAFSEGFPDGFYLRGSNQNVIGDIENYAGPLVWYEIGSNVSSIPTGLIEVNKDM